MPAIRGDLTKPDAWTVHTQLVEGYSDKGNTDRVASGRGTVPSGLESSLNCTRSSRSRGESRLWTAIGRHVFKPFRESTNPPWFDARGIAVGLAVGFGIPVGAQVAVLALLRLLFKFNSLAAFAFTWVNNPLTIIPLYYGYYYLGSLMLGRPISLTGEGFRMMMMPILHADRFWYSVTEFARLGGDVLLRWSLTAILLAAVSSVFGYVIGLVIQKAHCRRKAVQLGIAYEKLVQDLEQSLRGKTSGSRS